MIKRPIQILILFLTIIQFGVISGQETKLIERIDADGSAASIPYEKYELGNGLTVIVHEDRSDPLVHVDVTYHVGSAREELGRSGFAHFFEHMMFQGSKHVDDEEHFRIVNESGGNLNGTTNRDRTNYYQTVPSDQLERMLWLEADRMGFLLEAVTQEKFEIQRATVKNEKAQNFDNKPYGPFQELAARTMYPYGHPYSWLTIGYVEDLDQADVSDLKKFFLRWYGPNNATLTIGGDVDTKEVLHLAEKYFGPIPAGPKVEPMVLEPVTLDSDRYASYHDKNIRFPALIYRWPTVPMNHPDGPALDCLANLLGQGRTSFLYGEFIPDQRAAQASSSHSTSELVGEFTLIMVPFPGKSLSELQTELKSTMARFGANTITGAYIQKFKTQYESGVVQQLETVKGKVSLLAAHETFTGNPGHLKKQLKAYQSLTKEDVVRVYEKYIKDRPAAIISVLANEGEMPAKPDNHVVDTINNPFPTTDYSNLAPRKVIDTFDRAKVPELGNLPVVQLPDYWEGRFKNGIRAIGSRSEEIPAVSLRLRLYGGALYDPVEKSGLAKLTASMMNEATENHGAQEMAEKLEAMGSIISIGSSGKETVISLWTLKKNLAPTLELLKEKLLRPAFLPKDFERLKKLQWEGAKASGQQPQGITSIVFKRLMRGEGNPLSLPTEGLPETISNITLEDVREHYQKYYAPDWAELVVVGDIDQKKAERELGFLSDWAGRDIQKKELPDMPKISSTKIYFVDRPGAPQSEIRMGHPTHIRYSATGDSYRSILANYPLGGNFNSRINQNLREDKGFAYGASSSFYSDTDSGFFIASASVKANATAASVTEFLKELKQYREKGINKEELEFTRNAIGRMDALRYETLSQKAGFLNGIITYGLDKSYKEAQQKLLAEVTKTELDTLIRKHLRPDEMVILVVGDGQQCLEPLKELGMEVIELDTRGMPLEKGNGMDKNIKKTK